MKGTYRQLMPRASGRLRPPVPSLLRQIEVPLKSFIISIFLCPAQDREAEKHRCDHRGRRKVSGHRLPTKCQLDNPSRSLGLMSRVHVGPREPGRKERVVTHDTSSLCCSLLGSNVYFSECNYCKKEAKQIKEWGSTSHLKSIQRRFSLLINRKQMMLVPSQRDGFCIYTAFGWRVRWNVGEASHLPSKGAEWTQKAPLSPGSWFPNSHTGCPPHLPHLSHTAFSTYRNPKLPGLTDYLQRVMRRQLGLPR